jgi:hypothetical protein
MFRHLIAALLVAIPTGAAVGQVEAPRDWAVGTMPGGCMMQAVSPQGTMLSVWGVAGDDKLGFLLQNKGWNTLRDGDSYQLKLDFLGVSALPVEATARREIDSDGPGFFFQVEPGGTSGKRLLDAFTSAQGMEISREGSSVDTLSLAGGKGAMAALARCLAESWSADGVEAEPEDLSPEQAGVAI